MPASVQVFGKMVFLEGRSGWVLIKQVVVYRTIDERLARGYGRLVRDFRVESDLI